MTLCPAKAERRDGVVSDVALAERLKGFAGEGFRVRETEHFVVCYDAAYADLRALIGRIEGVYLVVERFIKFHGVLPPTEGSDKADAGGSKAGAGSSSDVGAGSPRKGPRLGILFFDKFADFNRLATAWGVDAAGVAGFYDQQRNVSVFCNTRDHAKMQAVTKRITQIEEELRKKRPDGKASSAGHRDALTDELGSLRLQRDSIVHTFNQMVVQHETAHQILFNVGVHLRGADNPLWFVEGLACQFEVPQTDASGRLTRVNQLRLADFRQALGAAHGDQSVSASALSDSKHAQRWLPIAALICESEKWGPVNDRIAYRYSQGWGLVYFLAREQPERFGEYIKQLAARPVGIAMTVEQERTIFEKHFGPITDDLERRWIDFILALRVEPE